jgi:hypothetical protein
MLKKILHLGLVLSLLFSNYSMAWNGRGHQLIGRLTEQLLQDTAQGRTALKQVQTLLGDLTLSQASVWADCVKGIHPESDFSYVKLGVFSECSIFESPEEIAAMRDYVQRNHGACFRTSNPHNFASSCHLHYHYTDVPVFAHAYQAGSFGTAPEDIVQALRACILVLQGKPAPWPFALKDQREALLLLLHLVGDIHQALHVGALYLDQDGRVISMIEQAKHPASHTFGGNALHVGKTNLHAMWDHVPSDWSEEEHMRVLLDKARAHSAVKRSVLEFPEYWANRSLQRARMMYSELSFEKQNIIATRHHWKLGMPLEYEARLQLEKREALSLASANLALLLNLIY